MKRKYIYVFVPLAFLILFSFFYIPFATSYERKKEEARKQEEKAREQKLLDQAEKQRLAVIKANEDSERRRKELEAKKARLEAEQKARQDAIDQEQKIFNEQEKYKGKVEGLQKDIEDEHAAIAKLQQQKSQAQKEIDFLKEDVRIANDNVKNIKTLLTKLGEADAARAKAIEDAKKANNS